MRLPLGASAMASYVPSRTNVTCTVARYSAILPSSTAAFSFSTSMPVMPRSVLLARSRALRTASSQLCGEAPMTCVMRATAMISSVQNEGDLHVDPILDDQPALDLDPLAEHLEPGDAAQRARRARHPFLDRFPEAVGGRRDDLGDPGDRHPVLAVTDSSDLAQAPVWRPYCRPHASARPRPPPPPRPGRARRAHRGGRGVRRGARGRHPRHQREHARLA